MRTDEAGRDEVNDEEHKVEPVQRPGAQRYAWRYNISHRACVREPKQRYETDLDAPGNNLGALRRASPLPPTSPPLLAPTSSA